MASGPHPSIWQRLSWRIHHHARQLLQRAVGRPIFCADCGRELFRGRPVIIAGRLRLLGARERNVRVAFSSLETLEFRHVELDQCSGPARPWVR